MINLQNPTDQQITDLLAFVLTQTESQLKRINKDPNYYKLQDDAKLAHGGIEANTRLLKEILPAIHKRLLTVNYTPLGENPKDPAQ